MFGKSPVKGILALNMQQKVKYSIVIPAYSEALLIVDSLTKVSKVLKTDIQRYKTTEVIVVAADSSDNTAGLAAVKAKLFIVLNWLNRVKRLVKAEMSELGC